MPNTHKISTQFVTTGKRPVIVVRSGNRKAQYPAEVSTTRTHGEAARKFAVKIFGKGVTPTKIEDGPTGDRFNVTVGSKAPEPEAE